MCLKHDQHLMARFQALHISCFQNKIPEYTVSFVICKEQLQCSIISLFLMLWLQQSNKLNFYSVKSDPKALMNK